MEKGYNYVYANIRGGGEFGPRWHEEAKGANRINAWNDMIAVGEHLIQEGYTSTSKMAIYGRSNGGHLGNCVS
jgi:prolyl oligopeptidase